MSRERWQQLDKAATPGRWDLRITGHYFRIFVGGFPSDGAQLDADAEFIAAARTAWPTAERECEQLRAERDAALTMLRLATDTLDALVDIHAAVSMDTDEDRDLHARVVSDFRQHVKTLRDESHLLGGGGQQQ